MTGDATGAPMTSTRTPGTTTAPDGVDTVPPLARLLPLGLQHVLAMYAGAVAVPLIVGGALGFDRADLAFLISADLFVAGLATIVQSVGFWRFGVRLPLVQGVTFAAVGPMIAIGSAHGITAVYGATIACGLFMVLVAPWFSQLVRLFPPIVTGTVILIIGVSLTSVAAGWITEGGKDGAADPLDVAFAAGVLLAVVLVERFAPRGLARVSVLLGLVLGTVAALFVPGMVDGSGIGDAAWFAVVTPFHFFGLPTFDLASIVSMLVVGLVIMTETTGDMVAVGEVVDRPVSRRTLGDGLRADGLGTVLGGVFNTFPYTAFAQNVGLVALTGVRSRYVATAAGGILVVLGLVPKVAAVVEAVPHAVLGGAGSPCSAWSRRAVSGRCRRCGSTTGTCSSWRCRSRSRCCRPSRRRSTARSPPGSRSCSTRASRPGRSRRSCSTCCSGRTGCGSGTATTPWRSYDAVRSTAPVATVGDGHA